MSNPGMVIEERSRDIGDFLVGRLLPFRKKRMVGPFIFIDHMGPSVIKEGSYMDIDPHPHIGLSTLTYLFKGEILHRDSIGSNQIVKSGDVNLMTAGSGVSHTERTPTEIRDGLERELHGYQVWIALPKEKEEMPPEFHHTESSKLPEWVENQLSYKLVTGKISDYESPVPTYSPQYMLEIKALESTSLDLSPFFGETGVVLVNGSLKACGENIQAGNMLIAKHEDGCSVQLEKGSHIMVFGGEPFAEERHIYWNFVATEKRRIEKAKERWANRQFPQVVGDSGYIPLPS